MISTISEFKNHTKAKEIIKKITFLILVFILVFSTTKVLAGSEVFSITNTEVKEKSETAKVNDISFDSLTISSDIEFHAVGDYIVFDVTLKNNTSQDYKIKSLKATSNNTNVSYTCGEYDETMIGAGEETIVQITAKYTKEVTDINDRYQDEDFELQLKVEDVYGNSVNPQTGDYLFLYVSLIAISLIGITSMHLLKNNSKSLKIQLVAVIALVVMIVPTFALATSTTYVFNFTNSISLLDKVVITTIVDGEENKILIAYGENILSYIGQEEKEGYNSSGWEDSNGNKITETTIATEDLILTSSSSPIEYTISYELAGGEAENNPSSYTIESETIILEKPQKAGYEFKGWTGTDLEEATKDVTIAKGSTGNREYTATWSVINYDITYDLDGGSATNPDTYTIESETFTLNKPTKDGFIFKGWTGDNGDTPQKEVTIEKGSTGEKNFTAVWALYDGPSEVTTFSPTNSTKYIFFCFSDWKSTEGEGSIWNDWDTNLPSLIFENEITRVRMGFSTTEYVSYNDVEIGIGLVAVENKNRMWFSDNYGKHLDGFWTIGYTENGQDHEIRFRTQSKIITEIETIY